MDYIIDSYYDSSDDILYLILKDNQTNKKKTKSIKNPLYEFKISKFESKIKYLENSENLKKVKIFYKDYKVLAKYLKHLYLKEYGEAEKAIKSIDIDRYQKLLKDNSLTLEDKELISTGLNLIKSLKKNPEQLFDIYDDIKIESLYHKMYEIIPYNNLNIGIIDLEVFSSGTTSIEQLSTKALSNLILATVYISQEDKYYTYVLLSNKHTKERNNKQKFLQEVYKYINEKENNSIKVEILLYERESELIVDLLKLVSKVDVLVGWNSSGFDIRYLYNRCNRLNLSSEFRRYLGEYFQISNAISDEAVYLTKVVHIDYIHMIKEFNKKANYVRYKLDYIAKQLLRSEAEKEIGKVKIKSINQEYLENLPNFIYYNLVDVKLVKMIDDVMNFIRILFTIKHYTGGFTTSYIAASNYLDGYLVKEANKNNQSVISHIKTVNYYSTKVFKKYIEVNSLDKQFSPLRIFLSVLDSAITKNIKKVKDKLKEIVNNLLTEDDKKLKNLIDDILEEYRERIYPFITKESSYPGAYVKNPRPGVYKGVIDFDASVTGDHIIPVIRQNQYFEIKIVDYDYKPGDKTIAFNPITKELEIVEIEELYIHTWKDEILEIEFENKEKISVTNNHSVYKVNNEGGIENIIAEHLKPGDYIPVFSELLLSKNLISKGDK